MSKDSGLGKQVYAPCEILLLQQSLFMCESNFMKIIDCYKDEVRSHLPQFWRDYRIKDNGVCLIPFVLAQSQSPILPLPTKAVTTLGVVMR